MAVGRRGRAVTGKETKVVIVVQVVGLGNIFVVAGKATRGREKVP